jgi:hypothetical protein
LRVRRREVDVHPIAYSAEVLVEGACDPAVPVWPLVGRMR